MNKDLIEFISEVTELAAKNHLQIINANYDKNPITVSPVLETKKSSLKVEFEYMEDKKHEI